MVLNSIKSKIGTRKLAESKSLKFQTSTITCNAENKGMVPQG